MSSLSTSVLKGPGVQARTLLVRNDPVVGSAADGGGPGAALRSPQETVHEAQQLLEAARAEASRLLETGRQEAGRLVAEAQATTSRLLGQAQVELGRATAEAESLRQQAALRLSEAGEIISTAAQARQLLEHNRAAAAELIASADAEVGAAYTSARDEGLEEGRRAGREEGAKLAREELRHEMELVFGIAAQAKVDRDEIVAAAEPEVVGLALAVARKVIAKEVDEDPDVLRGLVTRAMLKTAGRDRIRLRLNPVAIERLGEYLGGLTARFTDRGVDVVPDRALEVAGAVIETRAGIVDATADTQLAKVGRAMLALTGE